MELSERSFEFNMKLLIHQHPSWITKNPFIQSMISINPYTSQILQIQGETDEETDEELPEIIQCSEGFEINEETDEETEIDEEFSGLSAPSEIGEVDEVSEPTEIIEPTEISESTETLNEGENDASVNLLIKRKTDNKWEINFLFYKKLIENRKGFKGKITEDGISINSWVSRQKRAFRIKDSNLTQKRIDLLLEVDINFFERKKKIKSGIKKKVDIIY